MGHLNGTDRADSEGRSQTRLVLPGIARVDIPGTIQRRDSSRASSVDLQEAYQVGVHAAELALGGRSGVMSTIIRKPGDAYEVEYGDVPLDTVANAERSFPAEWIGESKADVADGFVRWALPLIGEPLPEFTQFEPKMADDAGLAGYTPQGLRR